MCRAPSSRAAPVAEPTPPGGGSGPDREDLDRDRLEAFESRVVGALNEAGTLLLLSLGHRTGLLDAMADGRHRTSGELAHRAGLDERYVREWLHGLTVAGVVELVGDDGFRLPAEHAALLSRHGQANLALYGQFVSMAGAVEDEIVDCFREGGGVPYEGFPRFHEIMAADSGQTVLAALEDEILPLAPELPGRLAEGIDVADLGCGRGLAVVEMARLYPRSRFTGWDLSREAVAYAREAAEEAGLDNVRFEVRDLGDFDETAPEDAFDLVTTFDAVHDQARPAGLLRGIARALRPDGVYLMQDIHAHSHVGDNLDHPLGAFLYTLSVTHCMTVSLAQGGDGLGTMWGRERALEMLEDAGFDDVTVHRLDHDVQNDYYVVRPG